MTQHLDGNSLAGPLSTIFRFDPTTALGLCNSCGDIRALGTCIVYSTDMGDVVRCTSCDNILITHVRTPTATYLTTRGLTWLQVTPDPADS